MQDIMDIKEVEAIKRLESEYDLQKASLLERKLRLMIDESPALKPLRKHVRALIKEYEDRKWSDFYNIPGEQVAESDQAEKVVNNEQAFIKKRKAHIRKRLKAFDMTQQDLGVLLGHSKSYMSELINGVSQFTLKDLVIIHRVLGISLSSLIPTYLPADTRDQVSASIDKLNKPKLGLKKAELNK